MAKVLVIRKTDRTIHQVSIENKATLMALNNRVPLAERWQIEEVDEKDAKDLPFIDTHYVTGAEASKKVQKLAADNEAKDDQIAELQRQLAAVTTGTVNVHTSSSFQPVSEAEHTFEATKPEAKPVAKKK